MLFSLLGRGSVVLCLVIMRITCSVCKGADGIQVGRLYRLYTEGQRQILPLAFSFSLSNTTAVDSFKNHKRRIREKQIVDIAQKKNVFSDRNRSDIDIYDK